MQLDGRVSPLLLICTLLPCKRFPTARQRSLMAVFLPVATHTTHEWTWICPVVLYYCSIVYSYEYYKLLYTSCSVYEFSTLFDIRGNNSPARSGGCSGSSVGELRDCTRDCDCECDSVERECGSVLWAREPRNRLLGPRNGISSPAFAAALQQILLNFLRVCRMYRHQKANRTSYEMKTKCETCARDWRAGPARGPRARVCFERASTWAAAPQAGRSSEEWQAHSSLWRRYLWSREWRICADRYRNNQLQLSNDQSSGEFSIWCAERALDDEEETDAEVRPILQEHAHADAHDVQRAAVAPADLRRRERRGRRSAFAISAAALLALLFAVGAFIYRQTIYF